MSVMCSWVLIILNERIALRRLARVKRGLLDIGDCEGAFTWQGFAINPIEEQISRCKRMKREIK